MWSTEEQIKSIGDSFLKNYKQCWSSDLKKAFVIWWTTVSSINEGVKNTHWKALIQKKNKKKQSVEI